MFEGGCKHAKRTNIHLKTLKNRKNDSKGGGCRLSTGRLGGVKISLSATHQIHMQYLTSCNAKECDTNPGQNDMPNLYDLLFKFKFKC